MYLGLDLGTSGLKAVVLRDDAVVAEAHAPLEVQRPHPGWSEQRPSDWIAAAETALDTAFKTDSIDTKALTRLLEEAGAARTALRYVHLSRHLRMKAILTPDQVARYAELRGYTADPCASIPDGHNAEMWRRHNGCDG